MAKQWHQKHISTKWGVAILGILIIGLIVFTSQIGQVQNLFSHAAKKSKSTYTSSYQVYFDTVQKKYTAPGKSVTFPIIIYCWEKDECNDSKFYTISSVKLVIDFYHNDFYSNIEFKDPFKFDQSSPIKISKPYYNQDASVIEINLKRNSNRNSWENGLNTQGQSTNWLGDLVITTKKDIKNSTTIKFEIRDESGAIINGQSVGVLGKKYMSDFMGPINRGSYKPEIYIKVNDVNRERSWGTGNREKIPTPTPKRSWGGGVTE